MRRVAELGRNRTVPVHRVYSLCGKSSQCVARIRLDLDIELGLVLVLCSKTRQIICAIRSRVRYLGNQVHYRWFHYQWLPELLDVGN